MKKLMIILWAIFMVWSVSFYIGTTIKIDILESKMRKAQIEIYILNKIVKNNFVTCKDTLKITEKGELYVKSYN